MRAIYSNLFDLNRDLLIEHKKRNSLVHETCIGVVVRVCACARARVPWYCLLSKILVIVPLRAIQ